MASYRTFLAALFGIFAFVTVSGLPARGADAPAKKPPASQPADGVSAPPAQGSALDRFQANVQALKLNDEQKVKIDKYFDDAREKVKALSAEPDGSEHDQKLRELSAKLRMQVGQILSNEQKAELVKKMPQPIDSSAMIDRIKQSLEKPGSKLTDEQRKAIDDLLDDTKKKLEVLRAQAQETKTDQRAKMQEVIADMRKKLSAILSPDSAGK